MSRISEVTQVHEATLDIHLSTFGPAGQGFPKREPYDQRHLRITVKPDFQISRPSSESRHLGVNQLHAAILLCSEFGVVGGGSTYVPQGKGIPYHPEHQSLARPHGMASPRGHDCLQPWASLLLTSVDFSLPIF